MADDQRCRLQLGLDLPHDPRHVELRVWVEIRGRLVEEKEMRALGQGTRQQDLALLPAGEPSDRPTGQILNADGRKRGADSLPIPTRRPAQPADLSIKCRSHNIDNKKRGRGIEEQLLGHVGDACAQPMALACHGPSEDADLSGGCRQEPVNDFEERRLSGSIRADHRNALPGGQADRHVMQRGDPLAFIRGVNRL